MIEEKKFHKSKRLKASGWQYLAIGKTNLKNVEIPLNGGNSKYFNQIV
jgi:hypothetical protein